jgi:hypothetical protein
VTTDGDSPDSQAGAGRNEEVEVDEGSADPKLDAMRAVWLSMRDEEPPGRGLSELMAAARNRAAAMEPSLWQRVLAGLRRPPVLALATALVLIGGGAIVALRPAPPGAPSAVSSGAPPVSTPGAVQDPTLGSGSASAPVPAAAEPAAQAAAPVPRTAHGQALAPTTPRPSSVPDTRAPAGAASSDQKQVSETKADLGAGGAETKAKAEASRDPPKISAPASPAPPAEVTLRGNSRRGTSHRPASHAGDDELSSPDSSAPDTRDSRSAPMPAPRIEQLGKDCSTAAQRGDCSTARRLFGQITRVDAAYAARVSKEASVSKCLAE